MQGHSQAFRAPSNPQRQFARSARHGAPQKRMGQHTKARTASRARRRASKTSPDLGDQQLKGHLLHAVCYDRNSLATAIRSATAIAPKSHAAVPRTAANLARPAKPAARAKQPNATADNSVAIDSCEFADMAVPGPSALPCCHCCHTAKGKEGNGADQA